MARYAALVLLVVLSLTSQRTFVNSAAIPQATEKGEVNDPQSDGEHKLPQDLEVRELENLKQPAIEGSSGNMQVSSYKSHSSITTLENGKHNEQHDLREYIDENGKLVAGLHQHSEASSGPGEKPHQRISTELDVPSEGIHHTSVQDSATEGQKEIVKSFPGAARLMQPTSDAVSQPIASMPSQEITDNGNRRSFNADITQEESNNMDHFSAYSGVQYSPLDMAEYIFWTGDEKGVTLAIEEFLQEGMMTREEAIAFLQEIKYNIEYLQAHYAQQRLKNVAEQRQQQQQASQLQEIQLQLEKNHNNYQQHETNERPSASFMASGSKFNHDKILKALSTGNYERNNNLSPSSNLPQLPFTLPEMKQEIFKKSIQDNMIQNNYKYTPNNLMNDQFEREAPPSFTEEDYEELLERLRVADFLYTEYSLEEVIYQLAKVMFVQSLSRGSSEAQLALQKFTSFLESEAEQGHISRALEKKVLDVLIESLTDTLNEHPELVSAARAGLGAGVTMPSINKVHQQIADQGAVVRGMTKTEISEPVQNQNAQNVMNHHSSWMKSRDHSLGENPSKVLAMQPVKRFKMAA